MMYTKKKFVCSFLFVLLLATAQCQRVYDRCSLARTMNNLGVPRNELAIWVCIAEHESRFQTDAKGYLNNDGSVDYGIFQINDRYWCQPNNGGQSHNLCNVACNALLTDNIDASVRCASKIKSEQGWTAWTVYNRHCSGSLPSIDDCFGTSHMAWGASCTKW